VNILVSGSIAYDSIMDFPDHFKNHILPDKIHNLNVSFLIGGMKLNYGGTAGNIAYNLKLLGEIPAIISTAGKDFEKYRQWMEENNIDHSGVKIIEDEFTALAHIITDKSDNQITAFYPGSMKYSGGEIKKELLRDSLAIVAPGFQMDMVEYPRAYKENNVPYIFDPGQQIPALSAEDLKGGMDGAKAFISNDYELSMVIKKTGWSEDDILQRAEILVTTFGEKGSVIKAGKEKWEIPPAKPKNTSDPTGAGDAYRAGFLKGIIKKWPLEKVGRLASVVSAYTVETYGTQTHKFSWEDIKVRYKKNFKEEI
jgi:adenosine kinase